MLKPMFARVLLEREKLTTKSNLIIPQMAERKHAPTRGVVRAVGPTADPGITVGSTVLFGQFAGEWIKDGDSEVYIVQDEDILAEVA